MSDYSGASEKLIKLIDVVLSKHNNKIDVNETAEILQCTKRNVARLFNKLSSISYELENFDIKLSQRNEHGNPLELTIKLK